jgi:TonB family protein
MSNELVPDFFGRYQVLEELGSGSMGVVHLCVDPRLARPVAIKVLKPPSDFMSPSERERYQSRFRQEAEAAGRLNHPGIVQIYDIEPSYIVMEFLEGKALGSVLRSGVRLTVRRIVEIVESIADALEYAHRRGVVHRDVKPANVMLLDDGTVKVMDFGVARLDTSNLTAVGTVVGSVRYMAPEQMMGERVDGKADVFSLAAVAYEMLTGSAPFPGKTITDVVSRVVHGRHVPPREANAGLPAGLDAIFARAFAPAPADRYAGAADFARDLRAAAKAAFDVEVVHVGEPAAIQADVATVKGAPTPTSVVGETLLVPPPVAFPEGAVLFESDPPGALVYVDNKPVGRTPLPATALAFGRHLVRMEAQGREAAVRLIELRPEHPLRLVSFTLPLPGPDGRRAGRVVPFSSGITPPRRIGGPSPIYPDSAASHGLEGAPVVELWVSESGVVVNAAIVESAGRALDEALLSAVTEWRFAPALAGGVPVAMRLTVQHLFRR